MNHCSSVRNLQPLSLVVFPGSGVPENAKFYFESAYQTWKLVWEQTLLELDGSNNLFSDHFTRQDYTVGIFHQNLCVALCCFRRADLQSHISSSDSWFKPWPQTSLQNFARDYRKGLAVSWLTIHPDYRRSYSNEHLKDFSASNRLCEQINFFLQDCEMELAFGITRNNRSVNKMSEYVGFHTVEQSLHHGIEVDLITVTNEQLQLAAKKFPQEAYELWNSKKNFESEPLALQSLKQKPKLKLVA